MMQQDSLNADVILPDGQITAKVCPALRAKIFRLTRRANQCSFFACLTQLRGGSRSSRTCGGMRWTRSARKTNARDAYGEVVWSWRRGAGVKFLRSELLGSNGGKRAVHRGEHEVSRKATAQGRPDASAEPVCSCAFLLCTLHTRPRVQRAPGLPCALCSSGGERRCIPRAISAARSRTLYSTVIASEAKQSIAAA